MEASLLALAREIQTAQLTQTAIVQNKEVIDDGAGGETETYTAGDSYPCLAQPVSPSGSSEEDTQGIAASTTKYQVLLPWDTVVSQEDRLEVDGALFEIVGSNSSDTNRQILHVQCTKVY